MAQHPLKRDPNQGRVRMWSTFRKRFEDVPPLEAALCILIDNEAAFADTHVQHGSLADVISALRKIVDGEP